MSPRSARLIRDLLQLPAPKAMDREERKAFRGHKHRYARLSSVAKTLYNANARALSLTVVPSNPLPL